MTTSTTPHPAVVGLPAKAVTADDWQPDGDGRFYRCFEGEQRVIATEAKFSTAFGVYAAGQQGDDGRILDGTTGVGFHAPRVFLSEFREDGIQMDGVPMSAGAARKLADLLVTAADEIDEIDGWTR